MPKRDWFSHEFIFKDANFEFFCVDWFSPMKEFLILHVNKVWCLTELIVSKKALKPFTAI